MKMLLQKARISFHNAQTLISCFTQTSLSLAHRMLTECLQTLVCDTLMPEIT